MIEEKNGIAEFKRRFHLEKISEDGVAFTSLGLRNLRYAQKRPRAVTDPDYLTRLILRTQETPHLQSLRNFLDFCDKVNS
jgi:hypothetical protein